MNGIQFHLHHNATVIPRRRFHPDDDSNGSIRESRSGRRNGDDDRHHHNKRAAATDDLQSSLSWMAKPCANHEDFLYRHARIIQEEERKIALELMQARWRKQQQYYHDELLGDDDFCDDSRRLMVSEEGAKEREEGEQRLVSSSELAEHDMSFTDSDRSSSFFHEASDSSIVSLQHERVRL